MATVRFNDINEFLDEIRKDADFVDRKIVRVTALLKNTSDRPYLSVHLVATARLLNGDIVRLERFVGYHFVGLGDSNPTNAKTASEYVRLRDELIKSLTEFDVRAGIYEESEGGKR